MSRDKFIPKASVSLTVADALVAAALAAAREAGFGAAVAVAGPSGTLRAFGRADAAAIFPAEVAIRKAATSATSGLPTHVWNRFVADPDMAPMAGLPGMMPVAGGYPLLDGGRLIGGIGVSGGTPEQDRKAAAQGLADLGFPVP